MSGNGLHTKGGSNLKIMPEAAKTVQEILKCGGGLLTCIRPRAVMAGLDRLDPVIHVPDCFCWRGKGLARRVEPGDHD